MEKHLGSFDFILDTVSAPHDLNAYLGLLKRGRDHGAGRCARDADAAQGDEPPVRPRGIWRARSSAASAETQEMLDFCAEHGITSDVEVIPIQSINDAYERMMRGDVKYRFVIDMASIK